MSQQTQDESRIGMGKLLIPLGLGTALSLMGDATLYTVLATHTEEAGVTLAAVGILLGVNRMVRLFLNGPAGLAYDRLPRRPLFVSAMFIGALSTVLYAVSHSFWPMLVGRMLWGLAWSGIWIGGASMILDVAGPQERGRWTGLYQIWFFVGAALGALGGGVLTDLVGYANTMWIGAAVTATGGVVALLFLPETSGARAAAEAASAHTSNAPGGARGLSVRDNPELWLAVVMQGLNRLLITGVVTGTLALVIQDWVASADIGLGVATVTGLAMAGRTVLSIVSAPLSGTLSDRQGTRWTIIAWSLAIGALGMGLLALSGAPFILGGIAALSIAGGSLQSLSTAVTGDTVEPEQRGRAIGLLHTAGDLGSAIGPAIALALMPVIGLRVVYLLSAVLLVLSLGPVVRLIKTVGPQRVVAPASRS